MAIFGVGSNWTGTEKALDFIKNGEFVLGWNEESASDLYNFISTLKNGDILYLKSNKPGSRKITIKGIGIVSKCFMQCLQEGILDIHNSAEWESLFIKVKWICTKQFSIEIPENTGKLTNIRAATVYEEYLPYVQNEIIDHIGLNQ